MMSRARLPAPTCILHEFLNARQQRSFRHSAIVDTEARGDHSQQIVSAQLARHDPGYQVGIRIDLRQQAIDQHRFPGADITGNHDKPLGMMQAVGQVGHRPPVLGAFKEKFGIGRQLKSQPIEPVKFSIHERSKAPRQADLNLIAPIGTADNGAIDIDKLIIKNCAAICSPSIYVMWQTGCQCLLICGCFGWHSRGWRCC